MSKQDSADNQKPDRGMTLLSDVIPSLGLFAGLNELPEVQAPEKPAKKTRAANAKLVAAAAEVTARAPTKEELAYILSEMVQCSFPHRDPGEVPSWIRRNGNLTLIIQPGINAKTGRSMGLPFGEWPRLLIPYIFREVLKDKENPTPEVRLGDTFNGLLRAIGGDPSTGRGKRGAAKALKEQLTRLANCRISFHYEEGTAQQGRETRLNMEVAKVAEFWWDYRQPDQTSFFDSRLVLGDLLFQSIINSRVPVDFRVLVALKQSLNQSSFAIDVYNWTRLRIWRMRKKDQLELRFNLEELQGHFGSQYKRLDNFKAALEEALVNVQIVSQEFDYRFEKHVLILTDRNARLAIPATDPQVATRRLERMQPYNQPSHKARSWFVREFPRYDVEDALAEFHGMIQRDNIQVQNPDALFRSFAKSYVKNRPL